MHYITNKQQTKHSLYKTRVVHSISFSNPSLVIDQTNSPKKTQRFPATFTIANTTLFDDQSVVFFFVCYLTQQIAFAFLTFHWFVVVGKSEFELASPSSADRHQKLVLSDEHFVKVDFE